MPIELPLPDGLRKAGWKVKIREKEVCEPPHVSILRRTQAWRINLRTKQFMDSSPNPSEVPDDLIQVVKDNWAWLCGQWDNKYPENPVACSED